MESKIENTLHWKINRDPFYSRLANELNFTEEQLINAGFFYDTATEDTDISKSINVMCTPINFLKKRYDKSKKNCVILGTGSYCPIHEGHIESMILAKKALEKNGLNVIGGYFSPGHDEYISQKNKEGAIHVEYRNELVTKAIEQYDWMSLDPWEGTFNKVAINFTDVITRLKMYISKHLANDIDVYFLCGGDNANFANTFTLEGHCVVINRPGHNEKIDNVGIDLFFNTKNASERIFFIADGKNDMSSSMWRKKNTFVVPPKKKLKLRVGNELLSNYKILNPLKPSFKDIEQISVNEQKDVFCKIFSNNHNIISLDSLIKGDHNLKLSRSYDLFGTKFIKFTERPYSESFLEQINEIDKTGNYILFDDDIHSCRTMKYAKNLLEDNNVTINSISSLNIQTNTDEVEVLDLRDFTLDDNSGLVVDMPGIGSMRVPYLYPYVCPRQRASIFDPLDFSINVWTVLMEQFKNITITLKNYRTNIINLGKVIGMSEDNTVYELCKWHVDLLVNFKSK